MRASLSLCQFGSSWHSLWPSPEGTQRGYIGVRHIHIYIYRDNGNNMETDIMGSIGVIEVPKGPRTQIKGFFGPNTSISKVFGP